MSEGAWNPVLPAAVYERLPELTGGAVKVAVVIARYADADGQCFPGLKTVVVDSGLSRRAAQNSIKKLCDLGLLEVTPGNGRGNQAEYRWSKRVQKPAKKGAENDIKGAAECTFSGQKGAEIYKKGCKNLHPIKEELSMNYSREGNDPSDNSEPPDPPKKSSQKKSAPKTPPSRKEFVDYCESKGFGHIAQKAYDYYDAADWHDSRGNRIRSWKQKLISVWFDEEKNPPPEPAPGQLSAAEIAEIEAMEAEIAKQEAAHSAQKSPQANADAIRRNLLGVEGPASNTGDFWAFGKSESETTDQQGDTE